MNPHAVTEQVSTEWVAGNVRAKALLNRRLGGGRARAVAAMGSLEAAQQALVVSPYCGAYGLGRHWPRPNTR